MIRSSLIGAVPLPPPPPEAPAESPAPARGLRRRCRPDTRPRCTGRWPGRWGTGPPSATVRPGTCPASAALSLLGDHRCGPATDALVRLVAARALRGQVAALVPPDEVDTGAVGDASPRAWRLPGSARPAATCCVISTTDTLLPARSTITVAPSAPSRMSSTASAASAGLRSRGATGSRSPPTWRAVHSARERTGGHCRRPRRIVPWSSRHCPR